MYAVDPKALYFAGRNFRGWSKTIVFRGKKFSRTGQRYGSGAGYDKKTILMQTSIAYTGLSLRKSEVRGHFAETKEGLNKLKSLIFFGKLEFIPPPILLSTGEVGRMEVKINLVSKKNWIPAKSSPVTFCGIKRYL